MKPGNKNSYNSLKSININGKEYKYYSLVEAEKNGLKGISKLNIIGGDVVEVSPSYDANNITSQLAAHLAYELLCLIK